MCAEEQLPSVFRTQEISRLVEEQEPSEEGHHDLLTIHRDLELTHDEAVQEENDRMNDSNAATIVTWMRNLGRVNRITMFELDTDYENIFLQPGLYLRAKRALPGPIETLPRQLVQDMRDTIDDGIFRYNLSWPATKDVPLGPLPHFHTLFAYLPLRLSLDSWVGICLTQAVDDFLPEISEELSYGYTIGWCRARVGEGGLIQLPNGSMSITTAFIGRAKPGRLVCVRQGDRPRPLDKKETAKLKDILRAGERMLLLLSFALANRTVVKLCDEYAIPQYERERRPLLSRKQVGQAVREILGDAWFDLPFDIAGQGSLREWSQDYTLKPDDIIDVDDPYI